MRIFRSGLPGAPDSYSSAITSSCFHIHENKKLGGSTICWFGWKSAYASKLATHFLIQTSAWLNCNENSVWYRYDRGFCRFGMRSIGIISYCLRKAWTVTFPVNLSPVSGTGPAEIHLFPHILELSLYNRLGIAAEKLSAATPSVCGFCSSVGPFPTMFSVQISHKVCWFT